MKTTNFAVNEGDFKFEFRCLHERLLNIAGHAVLQKLKHPIGEFDSVPLESTLSSERLQKAMTKMNNHDLPFLLVRDGQNSFSGVLRMDRCQKVEQNSSKAAFSSLLVSDAMDRNICIEPESASVIEVMSRMVYSGVGAAVIIDEKGQPAFIVSPHSLIEDLDGIDLDIDNVSKGVDTFSETGLGERVPLY